MKRISVVCALALVAMSFGAPVRLKTYAELVKALDSGRKVTVVAHYGKMKLTADGKVEVSPDATGGTVLDSWERFEKSITGKRAWVSSSHTVLISHPKYKYVQNYVKFRFYDDGAVDIVARYIKPESMEVVMDELFSGKISNGKDKEGVDLFAND